MYRSPVADIAFTLRHAAGFEAARAEGLYGDLDDSLVDAVLEEAGKFAGDEIAPLNRIGDTFGTPFKDGKITMPPGWKEAYTAWAAAGWNGLAAPSALGRPGLAAGDQRRLHRNVEFGLRRFRRRTGTDHGRHRRTGRRTARTNSSASICRN